MSAALLSVILAVLGVIVFLRLGANYLLCVLLHAALLENVFFYSGVLE